MTHTNYFIYFVNGIGIILQMGQTKNRHPHIHSYNHRRTPTSKSYFMLTLWADIALLPSNLQPQTTMSGRHVCHSIQVGARRQRPVTSNVYASVWNTFTDPSGVLLFHFQQKWTAKYLWWKTLHIVMMTQWQGNSGIPSCLLMRI